MTLPPIDEKARVVRSMFDRIAPRYDRLNGVMTAGLDRGWRRAALRAGAVSPGERVVDLACGTGDFVAISRAAGARVIGVDFARGMLEVARRRVAGGSLLQGDGQRLPLRDASVDVVTCGFALRNFVSIPAVLREVSRILRPEGRLVLLEVSTPEHRLVRALHAVYFRRVVPLLGAVLADREAYRYLPASVAYLPSPRELEQMLGAVGLEPTGRRVLGAGGVQLVTARRAMATGTLAGERAALAARGRSAADVPVDRGVEAEIAPRGRGEAR